MKKIKAELRLEKAARKTGGDKYAGMIGNESWGLYVLQEVSRTNGTIPERLDVIIGPEGDHIFSLERQAKKSGGDRYATNKGWTVYYPQSVSRSEGQIVEKIGLTFSNPAQKTKKR